MLTQASRVFSVNSMASVCNTWLVLTCKQTRNTRLYPFISLHACCQHCHVTFIIAMLRIRHNTTVDAARKTLPIAVTEIRRRYMAHQRSTGYFSNTCYTMGLWTFRPFVSSPPWRFAPKTFRPGCSGFWLNKQDHFALIKVVRRSLTIVKDKMYWATRKRWIRPGGETSCGPNVQGRTDEGAKRPVRPTFVTFVP